MFRPVVTESVAPESVRSGLVRAFLGAAAAGPPACEIAVVGAADGGGTNGAGGGTNGGGAGMEGAPIHIVNYSLVVEEVAA